MQQIIELSNSRVEFGDLEQGSFNRLLEADYAHANKVIMVDENTHDYCLEYLITTFPALESAEVILLPCGEENKVMEVCFQVWEALSEYGINRSDLIINLGGGVVTDMGGFIASVFKRGIAFVNVPTTLLGMVDAAIGGKTGIDMGGYKNQLGTFTMPLVTYIDTRFLATLPAEEWRNGMAESYKHALIGDKVLWNAMQLFEEEAREGLIYRSAALKAQIVNRDEKERHERKLLNFGHTVGHAIEGFFLLEEAAIPHGTAVAYGMIAESYLSFKRNRLSEAELSDIVGVLVANYPDPGPCSPYRETLFALMKNDKKNDHEGVRCVLLQGIGAADYDQLISEEEVYDALEFLDTVYENA